jgi:hypothetical protein
MPCLVLPGGLRGEHTLGDSGHCDVCVCVCVCV